MKVTRILAAVLMTAGFAGAAHAQGCIRLSWGSCDPWNKDKTYTGPAAYVLVQSIAGVDAPNVATDSNIRITAETPTGAVPDAWRFDDTGCQTGSQLGLSSNGFSKVCLPFKGTNPLAITAYSTGGFGEGNLRLAIAYDTFDPAPATRYTTWIITFDHSFSTTGPSDPGLTCGGAEIKENFQHLREDNSYFAGYLTLDNQFVTLTPCDQDPFNIAATWNGGFLPVAAKETTWGKVKGLYR